MGNMMMMMMMQISVAGCNKQWAATVNHPMCCMMPPNIKTMGLASY
jgi:hypothetical protein